MQAQAAVFDCDGLLLDSTHAWAQSFSMIAAELGHEMTAAEHARTVGSPVGTGAAVLSRITGAPVNEVQARVVKRFIEIADVEPPRILSGAVSLVRTLHGTLPLAVASNGPTDIVTSMLRRSGLLDAFDAVCTSETAGAAKPDPAVYLTACDRVHANPALSYGFADSEVGARAVQAAGMHLVFIGEPAFDLTSGAITAPRLDDDRVIALFDRQCQPIGHRHGP
ncbi:HAD family hydrolase [Streptomyces scopuliridis]|uniref:HAD family hydrolase n=1 Tax=Streptomyces scopuliridis TaxID=452529 RepID=UPI0036B3291E